MSKINNVRNKTKFSLDISPESALAIIETANIEGVGHSLCEVDSLNPESQKTFIWQPDGVKSHNLTITLNSDGTWSSALADFK